MEATDWARFARALAFARERHQGQLRKDGRTPFIDHVVRVAVLVQGETTSMDVICAALLHDTIEDTATSRDDLEAEFGAAVADLVVELTEDKRLPRVERKREAEERAPSLSAAAKLVKLADVLDNLYSLPSASHSITRRRAQLARAERIIAPLAGAAPELARRALAQITIVARVLDEEAGMAGLPS